YFFNLPATAAIVVRETDASGRPTLYQLRPAACSTSTATPTNTPTPTPPADTSPSNTPTATPCASPAGLDVSFNGSGKVITPIGSGSDYAQSVAIQSDGKIVVAGYTYNGSDQ